MNLGVTFESLRNLFFLCYFLFALVYSFDISCTPSLLSLSLTSVCVYSPSNATVTAVGVYNGDGVGLISGGSGIVTFTPSLSDVVMMSVRVGNETKRTNVTVVGTPDQSSLLVCPVSIFQSTAFNCTLTANYQGFPIVTPSSWFYPSSSMIAPRIRPLIGIGAFSSWNVDFGNTFVVTVFTSNVTGTFSLQDGVSLGTSVVVYSYQLITLQPYLNNMKLFWPIVLPNNYLIGGFISFWFTSFETEPSSTCRNDYVSIYLGNISSIIGQKPVYTFCEGATNIETSLWNYHTPTGQFFSLGEQILLNATAITVYFSSDSSNTFAGFQLAYDFTFNITLPPDPVIVPPPPKSVQYLLTNSSDSFSYRNYVFGDYVSFTISTDRFLGSLIQLQFTYFDITDSLLCDSDVVNIFDGISNKSTLLATLCGGAVSYQLRTKYHSDYGQVYTLSSVFLSTTPYMYIELITRSSSSASGFSASYTISLPTVIATGILANQAQTIGDLIDPGYLVIPQGLFMNSRSLENATLFYSIKQSDGNLLPSFLSFDIKNLEISGTFPNYWSGNLYLNVTASNVYNFYVTLPWVISTVVVEAPDFSSILTCPYATITLTSSTVTPMICTLVAKRGGVSILTKLSYIVPFLADLSQNNPSSGAIGSVTAVNPQGRLASTYSIQYVPDSGGGMAILSSGIAGVANVTINVFCATDATSRLSCSPLIVPALGTVTCTLEPRFLTAPVYSNVPFTLVGANVASPYSDITKAGPIVFSSFNPVVGYYFNFNFSVSSAACYYPVCVSPDNCFSPMVVVNPDLTSVISCVRAKLTAFQSLTCSVYPMISDRKTCSPASVFNVSDGFGSIIVFQQEAGPKLDFSYVLPASFSGSSVTGSVTLSLSVNGFRAVSTQVLNSISGPDNSSSLSCAKSAPRGASIVCLITARIAAVETPVLASCFTPAVLSGEATVGSVLQWRVAVQDPDNLVFQFSVQLSIESDVVVISDGISGVSATIVGTTDPDDIRMQDCPTVLTLFTSTTITCTFVPVNSGVIVQTFSNRFSLALQNLASNDAGTLTSIVALDSSSVVTSSAASLFRFSYTGSKNSQQNFATFNILYPNGGIVLSKTITLTVADIPDVSSQLSCVVTHVTAYSPVICNIFPRALIYATMDMFTPRLISGVGSFSVISPVSGSMLTFSVIIPQSYATTVISDGVSGNFITLVTSSPSEFYSWVSVAALPSSLILPSLGRSVTDNLVGMSILDKGSRVTGSERIISVACGVTNDYCVAATSVGITLSWGASSSIALGRDDATVSVDGIAVINSIVNTLESILVVQVGVIDTGSVSTAWSFALSSNGALFSWGDPSSAPSYFSKQSSSSFVPVLVPGNVSFTMISSGGSFMLGASKDGTVYSWGIQSAVFQIGRSGTRDIPIPISLRVNNTAIDWSSLAPITHLVTGYNYGIVISRSTRWFSWGLGLYNTIMPSGTLPLEHDYRSFSLPFLSNNNFIVSIGGNSNCLVVLASDKNLYFITLDYLLSSTISVRNTWTIITSSTFALSSTFISLSVGVTVVLASDEDGNLYSFSVQPSSDSPYSLISPVSLGKGRICTYIWSFVAQYCLASPPINVRINPKYASSNCCGSTCFNCSTLEVALAQYPMIGSVFLLEDLGFPHLISKTLVSDSTDIKLLGASDSVTVDCLKQQCIHLTGNGVIIDRLKFSNGASLTGGFWNVLSQLVYIRNSVISNMTNSHNGGAIVNAGRIVMSNVVFYNNSADLTGGAIYSIDSVSSDFSSTLTMYNVQFINNKCGSSGGAISSLVSVISGINVLFSSNSAPLKGGAIYSDRFNFDCTSCIFSKNSAVNGGALYASDSTVTFTSSLLEENTGSVSGGGVYSSFTSMIFKNTTIRKNYAPSVGSGIGAGVYCLGPNPMIFENSFLISNNAATNGGGIAAIFCSPQVFNTSFSSNIANAGGAVSVGLQAALFSANSIFNSNTASNGGAIVFQYCLGSRISETIFSNNSALINGGSIQVLGLTNVTIVSSRFDNNSAPAGGAIWWDKNEPAFNSHGNVFVGNKAIQGANIASEPKKLNYFHVWPQSFETNSGEFLLYPLKVQLIDSYSQVVSVDSSTSLSLSSTNATLLGQLSGVLSAGIVQFDLVAVIYFPTKSADLVVSGFFSGIGTYSTPILYIPVRNCVPGEYYDGGFRCIPCRAGQFSNSFGLLACESCSPGSYQDHANSSACISCSAGFYSGSYASTSCTDCDFGTFSNVSHSSLCTQCYAGTHAAERRRTVCRDCDVGKYSGVGQILCANCLVGDYSDFPRSSSCKPCPDGYYTETFGASMCNLCLAGSYSTRIKCNICPDGSYTNTNGSIITKKCWDDSTSTSDKTWCQCNVNRYEVSYYDELRLSKLGILNQRSSSVSPICAVCPVGANCIFANTNSTTVQPLPNYWPEAGGSNTLFFKCISPNCVGGTEVCAKNYVGPLCTVCATGLGRENQYDCAFCPDPATNKALIFAGVIILLFMNVFLIYSTIHAEKAAAHSILIKILTSCLQFNALAANFQFQFPSFITGLTSAQASSGKVADSFINFDCLLGSDYTPRAVYIRTLMYLVLVPFIFVAPAIVFFVLYLKGKATAATANEVKEMRENYMNSYITSVIVGLFLQHPAIAEQTLFMFACTKTGYLDLDNVLLLDMRESCAGPTYLFYRNAVAIPMAIFYVVGIPFAAFWLMKNHEHELDAPVVRARYQFLYGGYLGTRYYWEIVIISRKLLMIGIVVFFASSINLQALMAVLLIVFYGVIHLVFQPYELELMDNFEMFSLTTSFVTFYCGLFLFTSEGITSADRTFMSVVILLVNVAFFAISVRKIYQILKEQFLLNRARQKAEEGGDAEGFDAAYIPEILRAKVTEGENSLEDANVQFKEMQLQLNIKQLAGYKLDEIGHGFGNRKKLNKPLEDDIEMAPHPMFGAWRVLMRLRELDEQSILQNCAEFAVGLFADLSPLMGVDKRRLELGKIQAMGTEEVQLEVLVLSNSGLPSRTLGYSLAPSQIALNFQRLCRSRDSSLNGPDRVLSTLINPNSVKISEIEVADDRVASPSSNKK